MEGSIFLEFKPLLFNSSIFTVFIAFNNVCTALLLFLQICINIGTTPMYLNRQKATLGPLVQIHRNNFKEGKSFFAEKRSDI